MIFHNNAFAAVEVGDCLNTLRRWPDGMAQMCVTSPPYFGLRDYGHGGQIGLEDTPDAFVARLVEVFREVRRVLRDDGTLWLNIGDSYARTGGTDRKVSESAQVGSTRNTLEQMSDRSSNASTLGLKPKDLIGIPWLLAFALRADGWYLRQEIIWHKLNPMPESVTDRCTKAHESLFLLAKSERYYINAEAMQEPAIMADSGRASKKRGEFEDKGQPEGREPFRAVRQTRNRRSVWTLATRPYSGAHFAVYPPQLIEPCILAGSRPGDIVLDPFGGSGTTAGVALKHGRSAMLCELNPEYAALTAERARSIYAA